MSLSIIKLNSDPPGFGTVADSVADGILGNPVQHTHEYFCDDELGLYVGVWDTTSMLEPAEPYSMDEFMLVLEGTVEILDNQRNTATTITAGESFAIPKGLDCQWKQDGYLRKFYFISSHPDEEVPATPSYDGVIIPKSDPSVFSASGSNPFLTDTLDDTEYTDTKSRFRVSTLTAKPFEAEARPFPFHQLSVMQSGCLEIIDEQSVRHSFVPGDVFFIQKGTICAVSAMQSTSMINASLYA